MIDLGNLAGLHAHGHSLAAYCRHCDRWVVLDLARMIREEHGGRRLPVRVTCRDCGEVGQLQVRPPVPTRAGSNGWVMPGTAHQTV
jgi:RNase P subunit RPR2